MALTEKYKKLLESDGFKPDSPAIEEFVRLSRRSLPDDPKVIKKFDEEIKLLGSSFGKGKKSEMIH